MHESGEIEDVGCDRTSAQFYPFGMSVCGLPPQPPVVPSATAASAGRLRDGVIHGDDDDSSITFFTEVSLTRLLLHQTQKSAIAISTDRAPGGFSSGYLHLCEVCRRDSGHLHLCEAFSSRLKGFTL